MMETQASKNAMLRVLSLRDFRLLFAGTTTSLLGDQFALIATPWLALKLTGDPLALGIVLALEGLPRAAFMLLGGAITDRLAPRLILLISDILRLLLTAWMALAVFTGAVQIWMLYAFALGFGLVDGFAIPAGNSIVPLLVQEQDLQAGNSVMMGSFQLVGFVGPTLAGMLIGRYSNSDLGIGLAFALDALSFAASTLCLWLLRGGNGRQGSEQSPEEEGIWASILAGWRYVWQDKPLRLMFMVMVATNFLIVGPLLVGIPVLADQRLPEGAVAFGLLMSAYAGGNLGGYLMAGFLPRPGASQMRIIMIGLLVAFGLVIGSLSLIPLTLVDSGLLLILGLGNGYFAIIFFTWIQLRTPREMLGRMMSIVILSSNGLVPVSQAICGAVSKWSLEALFIPAGTLILFITLWAAFQPELKTLSESLARHKL